MSWYDYYYVLFVTSIIIMNFIDAQLLEIGGGLRDFYFFFILGHYSKT